MSRYQGVPGTRPVPVSVTQEAEMKSPLMFREAALPGGFPPPGQVGEVIVKEYPAYRVARTTPPLGSKDPTNAMFRPLFNHIKGNQIAMTAPVEMTYESNPAVQEPRPVAMAFMYRDPHMTPTTRESNIEVVDLPPSTVLSITVRGSYQRSFEKGVAALREWLAQNPGRYEIAGPPRFMGYNSPFVPWFLRMGEAQIPVKPR
jgi:effector-binding domain-containing protein